MAGGRQTLTPELRREVVIRLAQYDEPKDVRAWLKADHGIELSISGLTRYNPANRRNGQRLAADLTMLFNRTRKAFQENLTDIPMANKAVRIKRLAEIADKARDVKNWALSAETIEKVAKEVGGMYEAKLRVAHEGAVGQIPIESPDTKTPQGLLTTEEAYKQMMGVRK